MSGEFIDTNVLVYAHDRSAEDKHERAASLITRIAEEGSGRLSVQVLQEFYWIVTRKVPKPLTHRAALNVLEDFATWPVFTPSIEHVIRAAELGARHRLSFWDAMILCAAIETEAGILWSEDLSPGRRFESVTVRNPFV